MITCRTTTKTQSFVAHQQKSPKL